MEGWMICESLDLQCHVINIVYIYTKMVPWLSPIHREGN